MAPWLQPDGDPTFPSGVSSSEDMLCSGSRRAQLAMSIRLGLGRAERTRKAQRKDAHTSVKLARHSLKNEESKMKLEKTLNSVFSYQMKITGERV